jgi:hypothetical protein
VEDHAREGPPRVAIAIRSAAQTSDARRWSATAQPITRRENTSNPNRRRKNSPMERYYMGLDVHSRESVLAIKTNDGELIARGALPTSAPGLARLRDEHGLRPETPMALETGTSAFFVARELARLDLVPVVIDAHEVRRNTHRPHQKSDRRDALVHCGLSRGFYQSVVHVPSPEIGTLCTMLSRRWHFIWTQVAEVNAVKRLLPGGNPCRARMRTDAHWERLLASGHIPGDLDDHVSHHFAVWRQSAERVRALDLTLGTKAKERRDSRAAA